VERRRLDVTRQAAAADREREPSAREQLSALQAGAGNQAVLRWWSRGRRAPARTVQRLVVRVTSDKDEQELDGVKRPDDWTELSSVAFALERTRGAVQKFKDSRFTGVRPGELIVFLAHGSEGTVKGVPAPEMAARLTDTALGLPATIGQVTIMFMSCYAGADPKGGAPDSSVVAELSRELTKRERKDVTVIGATGPTVKSPQLGDHFYVIRSRPRRSASRASSTRSPAW
jgi:hypothetical protein